MKKRAGFREIEHAADWAIEVWSPDLPGLFRQAAKGMYSMAKVRLADGPRLERDLCLQAADIESLLVSFLSELLFSSEVEGLGFDCFDISIENNASQAHLQGAPILSLEKEIKAVTYYDLKITSSENGYSVKVTFDV